jgi:hypothetical protein
MLDRFDSWEAGFALAYAVRHLEKLLAGFRTSKSFWWPGIAPHVKKTGFMKLLRSPSLLLFLIAMSPPLTFAQGANPGAPLGASNPYEYRLRCVAPNPPANPYRRKFGCKDVHFGTKETLSGDWSGARSALRDEGITPTASHVVALQTNPGGHVPHCGKPQTKQRRSATRYVGLGIQSEPHVLEGTP